jgi:hypothetical protein
VRGFGARRLGRPEINFQLVRQPGNNLSDERAFVHVKSQAYSTGARVARFPGLSASQPRDAIARFSAAAMNHAAPSSA